MFVTFFIAYLDPTNGDLLYSNAGHNPLLIYRHQDKRCTMQKMSGPPLGIFSDADYYGLLSEYRLRLEPGDLVLQYTDGLSESANASGEQFSVDRIVQVSEEHATRGARTLVDKLTWSEEAFRGDAAPTDDITLLALSATAVKPAGVS
jgi:sigma-B regulation protein RsbU (phosphoserine phosphatase)